MQKIDLHYGTADGMIRSSFKCVNAREKHPAKRVHHARFTLATSDPSVPVLLFEPPALGGPANALPFLCPAMPTDSFEGWLPEVMRDEISMKLWIW